MVAFMVSPFGLETPRNEDGSVRWPAQETILKGFPVRVIVNMPNTRDGIHNFSLGLIATGWDFRAQYTRVCEQLRDWKDDHHQPEAF